MKTLVAALLLAASSAVNASDPFLEGDALACVQNAAPSKSGQPRTVSFNGGHPLYVSQPGSLASGQRLKAAEDYTAVFSVGETEVQSIKFSFKDYSSHHVCFRHHAETDSWLLYAAPADWCNSCSAQSNGT